MGRRCLRRWSSGGSPRGEAGVPAAGRFLGLDAGGSATRFVVCDGDGGLLRRGALAPVSGHLYRPEMRAGFVAALAPLAGVGFDGAVAGITGLTGDAKEASEAADILSERLAIRRTAIRVEEDLWVGYHAAFRPGEGHAVYAGTGSVGLHVGRDGGMLRVGGRGMLIDDGGSAFWIGREGLNLVYRRVDGGEDGGPLGAALFGAIGARDWNTVRAHVYRDGRNNVAQLARAVAAAGDADAGALAILRGAGAELARLAQALVARAGPLPVALLGRAAALHPVILQGFTASCPGLAVSMPQTDPALAAARLAACSARRARAG